MKKLRLSYTWHSLRPRHDIIEKEFYALTDLQLEDKHVDGNFFKSRKDAIKWMQERVAEDELFCEGDTLILTEMFFT